MQAKTKNIKLWIIAIGCLIFILPLAWLLQVRLEGQPPTLELDLVSPYIGASQEITIAVSDSKSGLRRLWVGLLKDGKEVVLHAGDFPSAGLLSGGSLKETSIKIGVAPPKLGFSEVKQFCVWLFRIIPGGIGGKVHGQCAGAEYYFVRLLLQQ